MRDGALARRLQREFCPPTTMSSANPEWIRKGSGATAK